MATIESQQGAVQTLVALRRESANLGREMDQAQRQVDALAEQLDGAKVAAAAASQAQAEAAAKLAASKARYDELKQAVSGAQDELRQIKASAREAGAATGDYATQIAAARERLAGYKSETAAARATVTELNKEHKQSGAASKEAATAVRTLSKEYDGTLSAAKKLSGQLGAKSRALDATRASLQAAGVNTRNLASEQKRLAAEMAVVEGRATRLVTAHHKVGAAAAAGGKQVAVGMRAAGQATDALGTQLKSVAAAVGGIFAVSQLPSLATDLSRTADLYANIGARLELVNSSQAGFNVSLQQTADLARNTHSGLESTANLLAAVARAGEGIGISQEAVLRLTETINKANQVSGASAASADAAVTQLIQGLQSGVLRGEEFNSVMEQAPRLARALADGLGVPLGALRAMAQQGKLTSEVVIGALQAQADAVDAEFSKLPLTIGRAMTNLSTNWTQFLGELDKTHGTSAAVANALNGVANNLESIGSVAMLAGEAATAVLAGKLLGSVVNFGREAITAAQKVGGLGGAIKALPTSIKIGLAVVGYEMLVKTGELIGETAAKWAGADEMLRRAAESTRQLNADLLHKGQELAHANALYRDAVILTAEEVARLSEAERAAYLESLTNAKDYYLGATRAVEAAKELGIASEFSAQQVSEGMARARDGMAAFEAGSRMSRAELDALLSVDASILIEQFDKLTASGKDVSEALKGITEGFDPSRVDQVRGLGQALIELQDTGKISADQVGAAWQSAISKLDGTQLNAFTLSAQAAFGQSERDVAALAAAMDGALRASIAATGQDFGILSSGLSQAAASALGHVETLVTGFDALKEKGVDASAALTGAIDFATNTADSEKAVDMLRATVEQLGATGKLSGDQVATALDKIKGKADQITPGINSVAEALKTLGVTSDAELKKTEAAFREAYKSVVGMGGSVREQESAFRKYAEAAVAANGGVADSSLKVQAAMHGLTVEVDAAGRAVVRNFAERAANAFDTAATAAGELNNNMSELEERAERLADGVERVAGGFRNAANQVVDAQGNVLTAFGGYTERGAYERAKSAGIDEAEALRLAAEYLDYKNAANSLQRFLEAIDKAVLATARAKVTESAQRTTPVETSTQRMQQVAQVHRVEITLGGRGRAVTTDAAGAAALSDILRELEAAAGRV
ncbi:tape measure protein [Azoarcus communis]|uniref:tape measure protein n=1 Tax=Parazoarcus communis TaxID=41977 RepID=UPI00145970E2|nr:tape measure protein [Parazoarcus communis]